MPRRAKRIEKPEETRSIRKGLTPESRENQLIALAVDLVEQRLLDGTASSQETVHFLKLGSMKNRLEMEKLREENKLLQAKTESLQSARDTSKIYADAIAAMRLYSGGGNLHD